MSVRIEPFEVVDLTLMEVQPKHAKLVPLMFAAYGLVGLLRLHGSWSWTAWSATGRPLICAGVLPNGGTWAFFSADCRRDMVAITRLGRRLLDFYTSAHGVAYADIDPGHTEAVRWAALVGFKPSPNPKKWFYTGA